ncbi:MAG: dihydrodipicolinate synthase family protein, partial [Dehalococcoidia bacterium]
MATTVQAPAGAHRAIHQPNDLKPLLRGALAFPITPYANDGSLDLDGVRANARWLAESGICAVVAPSGTGELFGLSPDECAAVIEATVDAVAGRKPVIAGVGYGPSVAADLARRAESAGADGILVMPPYYGKPDPQGLLAYYRTVAAATSLGIMPYARDAAAFTPALVEQMARDVPNFIAFKDGRGDVRL